MILKGSQRGGAKQLGLHLLKTVENEHVEIHDVRGFLTDDVVGALREAEAVSKGTKCRQFLFSVSLNPPETESVRVETFEQAIAAIEEKQGLTDQPRVVVFHEKEGRRHCHVVWSRIDAETMTAILVGILAVERAGVIGNKSDLEEQLDTKLERHNEITSEKGRRYTVIFDDLKRFARDTEFHIKLRREFAELGASIECLNFNFEDTPEGRFIETIIAAQGQLEREQNKRRAASHWYGPMKPRSKSLRSRSSYWPIKRRKPCHRRAGSTTLSNTP